MQYCIIYFFAQNVPISAFRNLSGWPPCPTDMPPSVCFLSAFYSLAPGDALGSCCIFLVPALKSATYLSIVKDCHTSLTHWKKKKNADQ